MPRRLIELTTTSTVKNVNQYGTKGTNHWFLSSFRTNCRQSILVDGANFNFVVLKISKGPSFLFCYIMTLRSSPSRIFTEILNHSWVKAHQMNCHNAHILKISCTYQVWFSIHCGITWYTRTRVSHFLIIIRRSSLNYIGWTF